MATNSMTLVAGRRTKRVLENSTFTGYQYDLAGQMTNIVHLRTNLSLISSNAYGYDSAGQRTWVKRGNGKGDVYKYDAIGQLTNVLYEATNVETTPVSWTNEARYVFDAAGNRKSVTLTNTGTTSYTANALNYYNYIGDEDVCWDDNGNLSCDGIYWWYNYDAENRLVDALSWDETEDISYVYDAFGRLIERAGPDTSVTRFYYDNQWRVIAEYDGDNNLAAKYVYGPGIDEVVRMNRGGTNYYYHAAALGTVTEITSTNGTLLEQYRYDVYGEPTILSANNDQLSTSAIGNRLMFQGRDRDPDTGLYNFRHRYYSPSLGRFSQVDPVRHRGGLNLYSFVFNSPVNSTDSDGRFTLIEVLVGVGVIAIISVVALRLTKVKGHIDNIADEKRKTDEFLDDPMHKNPGKTEGAVCRGMAEAAELLREVPGTSANPFFEPANVNPIDEMTEETVETTSELIDAYLEIGGTVSGGEE